MDDYLTHYEKYVLEEYEIALEKYYIAMEEYEKLNWFEKLFKEKPTKPIVELVVH